jgi:hypothetical protein
MRLRKSDLPVEQSLDKLADFESSVDVIPVGKSVTVEVFPRFNSLSLSTNGFDFVARIDSKIIHQFGSRVWPGLSLAKTETLWKKHLRTDLPTLLSRSLSNSDTVVRYFESNGKRHIYGITSQNFVQIDQRLFRKSLVEELNNYGITSTHIAKLTPFGEVVENFTVPDLPQQVGLKFNVIYGLNTGYSSYRLHWGRVVLICSNGLTAFRNLDRERWLHTKGVDIRDFISVSVASAYHHLSDVEKQITEARNRAINCSALEQLLTRLVFAQATKDRISRRLKLEFSDTGPNEWSLSQALTFLGQHEQAIPFRVKDDLTRLGSTLLEQPLEQVVSAPAVVRPGGFYDILR